MTDRKGFTLVEIMVAGGLALILGLGVMTFITFNNRAQQSVRTSVDATALMYSIQMLLNNPVACQQIFAPFNFPPPGGAGLPRMITPPVAVDPLVYQGTTFAKIGFPPTGATVSAIQFDRLIDDTNAPTFLANLHLEITKNNPGGGGTVGSPRAAIDFPVAITTSGVAPFPIIACGSSNGIPSGAIMHFDLATCPAGWTPVVPAQGRYIVGLNPGGTRAGVMGTPLTNLEDKGALLKTPSVGGSYGISGRFATFAGYDGILMVYYREPGAAPFPWTYNNWPQSGGAGAATNAPYIQYLVCKKN